MQGNHGGTPSPPSPPPPRPGVPSWTRRWEGRWGPKGRLDDQDQGLAEHMSSWCAGALPNLHGGRCAPDTPAARGGERTGANGVSRHAHTHSDGVSGWHGGPAVWTVLRVLRKPPLSVFLVITGRQTLSNISMPSLGLHHEGGHTERWLRQASAPHPSRFPGAGAGKG